MHFLNLCYSSLPPVILNCSANYISLILEPGKGVYEYEVKFAPEVDAMNVRFQLISSLFGRKRTFDGTILYLPQKLDEEIKIYNETTKTGLQVTITIIFKRQKRLGECVHLYNVLFKRIMVVLDLIRHGRNHYNPKEAQVIPQYKLEVWPGYVTAVDEYEGGIQLCFDASHRVLRTQTLANALVVLSSTIEDGEIEVQISVGREYVSKYPTNFKDELFKAVIGQSVLTRYNNKLYRVDDLMWNKTPGDTFEKHGKLTREQIVCLVPEFCYLTGLTDSMRNDYQLMKSIAMYTRITPNQRQMALQKFINNVNQSQEATQLLLDWGLKLSPTTAKLEGRTLNPEAIMFGKNGKFPGSYQADWGSQCTRNQVLVAVNLNNWVVVYVPKDQRVSNDFVSTMKRVGPQMGIMVSDANMVPLRDDRVETFLRALRESITPSTQIVVIICPSARTDRYSAIKKLCCVEKPIASQVINARTIMKQDKIRSITQKICLQMNCKLGGSLWRVQIPFKNVMVCGVDSYHDTESKGKSWAGFVASLDGDMTKWYSRVAVQLPSQELLDTLLAMLINAIHRYKEENHQFPDKIIFYRDGVGDGQLNTTLKHEIPQIENCFSKICQGYAPKLTFVVCQKRINTRIFADLGGSRGGGGLDNPPPGSIMDHTITRRQWYDFFLVSQHVRQGTVTPTHYVVVYDSANMKPDHVQRFTYKMCHMYYNWPGTIRVPAPCQLANTLVVLSPTAEDGEIEVRISYAHKLAQLVGTNLKKEFSEQLADRLFFL
uniref:Piwi domain-containing protein n=1 Tax=Timema genevievae TaxID=629358 RepID=A0A7R9PGW1_TIMGE|nr:unnamed protein product [Timema genevievae]